MILADKQYGKEKIVEETKLLKAIQAADENIRNVKGGPFGACLCVEEEDYVEANHVIPLSDVSAHAEIDAIRLFIRKNGYSHVEKAELYSSGECCPMCLSAAAVFGVSKIVFAHDRKITETGGFSDKSQYELLKSNPIKNIKFDTEIIPLLDKNNADFMIIDSVSQEIIAVAKKAEDDDLGLASLRLVRRLCEITENVWAAEKYKMLARYIPHPAGLIAADWAHLLRRKNEKGEVDNCICEGQLICASEIYEKAYLKNKNEEKIEVDNAKMLYEAFSGDLSKKNSLGIEIKQIENEDIRKQAEETFFKFTHTKDTTY